jgi:hypothetical protein
LARVNHLPNVHLPNSELAIERRDKRLLRDAGAHLIDNCVQSPEFGLGRVEFGARNHLLHSKIAGSFEVRLRQLRFSFCRSQKCFLLRRIEFHEHLALFCLPAVFEIDFAHNAG